MLKKTASFVFILLIFGSLTLVNSLLIADSVRGFHSLIDKVGIDPVILWILLMVGLLVLRIFKQTIFPKLFFYSYIYIILPVSTVLAVVFTYIELSHYYNFLYSNYFIYFERVTLWAIASWTLALVLIPEKIWEKQWHNILFGLPVGFLAVMALIWTWPQDIFLKLVQEDNLIENAQVLVLLTGSVAAFLISKNFLKKRLDVMAGLFLIVAASLFFIAGDEISWGQRILGFRTPTELVTENLQYETTIHNVNGLHQLVGYGYILIGLCGAFAWIIKDLIFGKKKTWVDIFIPGSYLFFFFYLSLVYNAYSLGGVNQFGEWSEVAELMLYSGVTLFLIIQFLEIKFKKF